MLPKKRRLTAAEVREVIALGKGVRGGVISLKYVENKGFFRAAVVAPKSVARKATDRNRLRRALYQVLSTLSKEEAIKFSNISAVFFVRSIPQTLIPTFRDEISGIVKKLN